MKFKCFFLIPLISFALSTPAQKRLRFIADVNFPTDTRIGQSLMGGLSGLKWNPAQNLLWAISDDPSRNDPARIYPIRLDLHEYSLNINPLPPLFLLDEDGQHFDLYSVDFEGVALMDNNFFILSTEGNYYDEQTAIPPLLGIFNAKGTLVEQIPIPSKFIPNKERTKGVQHNKSVESLALSPDKKFLFTANENKLIQDKQLKKGEAVRILKYKYSHGHFQVYREYVYLLEKNFFTVSTETGERVKIENAENGLVDFIALDNNQLLTLERAWLPQQNRYLIHLYKVDLSPATNVDRHQVLVDGNFIPVKKELFAELSNFIEFLSVGHQSLDNIEGLAIGPQLPNGNDSLILVSDNNFDENQRTQFLAFEILK